MLRIIVSKWGDMYGEEYIDRLKESIAKYITVDWDLTVIRDCHTDWEHYSNKWFRGEGNPSVVQGEGFQNGYHHYNLGGIPLYRKMYPFGLDDFANDNDTIIMMDIDMLITADLKYFTTLNFDKPWVQYDYNMEKTDKNRLIKDFINQNITPINTSVTVWKKGQLKPVYDLVNQYKDEIFFTYRRVDAYVWYRFGVKGFFNFLPPLAVDWYCNNSNAIIQNMAGEPIKLKNEIILT